MVRNYTHMFIRKDYPGCSYRMEAKELPRYIHVTITEKGDTKYLTVHSRIHVNKEVRLSPDYSASYSDKDLLEDHTAEVYRRFIN